MQTGEFQRVYSDGKKLCGQWLQVLYLPNHLPRSRFGLAVGRRHGKAVKRNQLKRWIREAVRLQRECLGPGYDVVLLPRTKVQVPDYASIVSDFLRICSLLNQKKEIGIRHSNHSLQP